MSSVFDRQYQVEDEERQRVTRMYEEGRKYSYELTQKLTYFVITAELVFCGYMLLNADKVINLEGASWLFLATGVAALLGILWRFCYNITYYAIFHNETNTRSYRFARRCQSSLHNVYAVLTILSFVWAVTSGYFYLREYPSLQQAQKGNSTLKPVVNALKIPEALKPLAPSNKPSVNATHQQ